MVTDKRREINAKGATSYGQKSPAANDDQTLFKAAGAIVLGVKHNMAEHQIKVKDDKPIKQRYYPKNPKIQGEINAKADELLQMGFIEHSKSPYSSPIVMVKKKTGKWRLCVDFRHQLREARYISSLDLKDGYGQIPLEKSSRQYTAFTVPDKGLFQWRVMPFGLHSASATLQRVLDQVIGP